MVFLSFVYRFVTNFALLAMVYFSLNFMEKYPNRAILAMLVLVYTGMRAASTLRAFYFYQKIEKLEARHGACKRRPMTAAEEPMRAS
jgi:hypothetical protein